MDDGGELELLPGSAARPVGDRAQGAPDHRAHRPSSRAVKEVGDPVELSRVPPLELVEEAGEEDD